MRLGWDDWPEEEGEWDSAALGGLVVEMEEEEDYAGARGCWATALRRARRSRFGKRRRDVPELVLRSQPTPPVPEEAGGRAVLPRRSARLGPTPSSSSRSLDSLPPRALAASVRVRHVFSHKTCVQVPSVNADLPI